MTLKECLVQYCDTQTEIKKLETRIEELEQKSHEIVSDSVESTTKCFPIIRTHKKIKGLDQNIRKKLEYYKTILEDRYNKLLEQQIQVEEFIDKLPTSRLRLIFTYRYINQYSWIKVAQMIGNNATEDSVKKEHSRFLEKNTICPECPENL